MRRNSPNTLPSLATTQHPSQCQQVLHPEMSPASGHGHEGVDALDVSPACRYRIDPFFARPPEEDAVLPPGVAIAHELEPLAGQRVERVRDRKSSRTPGTICSRRLTPSLVSSAP